MFFDHIHCKCVLVCNQPYNSIYGIFWPLEFFFILYSYVYHSFPCSNTFHCIIYPSSNSWKSTWIVYSVILCTLHGSITGLSVGSRMKQYLANPHVKNKSMTMIYFLPHQNLSFPTVSVSKYNLHLWYLILLTEHRPAKCQEKTGSWHSPVAGKGGELYPGVQKCRGEGQEGHHGHELCSFFSEMVFGDEKGVSRARTWQADCIFCRQSVVASGADGMSSAETEWGGMISNEWGREPGIHTPYPPSQHRSQQGWEVGPLIFAVNLTRQP